MLAPQHGYLENTIPSIRASFAAGADPVEPVGEVRRLLPGVRTASCASLKSCLLRYLAGANGRFFDAIGRLCTAGGYITLSK